MCLTSFVCTAVVSAMGKPEPEYFVYGFQRIFT